MASNTEHVTLVCLFHHTDRAERTVQELLELGVPSSHITVLGHARATVANVNTGDAALDTIDLPEADRRRFRDGLHNGGSVVAVSAPPDTSSRIEDIFARYSAEKIDEEVIGQSRLTPGSTAALSGYRTAVVDQTIELPPGDNIFVLDGPPVGTVISRSFDLTDQRVTLLRSTDLVEDTDLVEPPAGSSLSGAKAGDAGETERYDPDAPLDNVRNPAADRLNDPLNRR